jgi:hypothetical protein
VTPDQENLLLTIGRVLRARLRHKTGAWDRDDYNALKEALKPFDGLPSEPINEELR